MQYLAKNSFVCLFFAKDARTVENNIYNMSD